MKSQALPMSIINRVCKRQNIEKMKYYEYYLNIVLYILCMHRIFITELLKCLEKIILFEKWLWRAKPITSLRGSNNFGCPEKLPKICHCK